MFRSRACQENSWRCWFLNSPDWQPDEALEAFLTAGPPPVYFGFGSVPGIDRAAMAGTILEALETTGKRGLLAGGGRRDR